MYCRVMRCDAHKLSFRCVPCLQRVIGNGEHTMGNAVPRLPPHHITGPM